MDSYFGGISCNDTTEGRLSQLLATWTDARSYRRSTDKHAHRRPRPPASAAGTPPPPAAGRSVRPSVCSGAVTVRSRRWISTRHRAVAKWAATSAIRSSIVGDVCTAFVEIRIDNDARRRLCPMPWRSSELLSICWTSCLVHMAM